MNFLIQTQVCDFKPQCQDESDESLCPSYCDFDTDMCYWTEQHVDGLDWIWAEGIFPSIL